MELDPATLTLAEMLRMDAHALHHLAQKTAGSLTRYRALLGRLLLAIGRTDAARNYGCSSGVHYGVVQLGLSNKKARLLVQVARRLEELPHLRRLANEGRIDWAKLREIIRVATAETERQWAEISRQRTYAEVEDLVARSRQGEIPTDRIVRTGPRNELRCRFEPEQMAVLERGLQVMCQQAGRVIPIAEAIELLFAEKLSEQQPDPEQLLRVRQQAVKDLQWTDLINAETEAVPGNAQIRIVNPKSRKLTPAQRRAILRREGHCCAVPGCQNTIWLDAHHIIFYADGGLTTPENIITLCSNCHQNLHDKRLRIEGQAPHGVRFLNQFGQDIRQQRDLDIAFWLDIWCGWRGGSDGRRYLGSRHTLAA